MINGENKNERVNWPEPPPSLIPDGPLIGAVLAEESPQRLREILQVDVARRAWVHADENHVFDPEKPFIVYGPMNREPEKSVAIAVAKLGYQELGIDPQDELLITGIPRSATWIAQVVMEKRMFPNARQVILTKNFEEIPSRADFTSFEVASYVHNRRADGSRGTESVYVLNPGQIDGAHLIVMEDVIAEGFTVNQVAGELRKLGADRIYVMAVFSKGPIQGGTEAIRDFGLVDNLIEAVRVAEVKGPGPAAEQLVFDA